MGPKHLFLLLAVWVPSSLTQKGLRAITRLKLDPLSKTRCDIVCQDVERYNRASCRTECKLREIKPGTCPASDSPKWAEACVKACESDAQCDDTEKCCHHGCGSTCSEPTDLLTIPGLPPLPSIVDVKERNHSIQIHWTDGVGDAARAVPGHVFYLLEEQHHVGAKYEEEELGDWSLIMRTNKTKVNLRVWLKPGRWYRFRVAAVSSAGSRGFSAPSFPFTARRGPRPPPRPRTLRVTPLETNNGTISIRLHWKEPKSDLPVVRYKVFWSRRLRGVNQELDSVVVNHQTVPKDQTHCDITDLQKKSMYFLQVQTISQYGDGKIRSEKAAMFYNTTDKAVFSGAKQQLQSDDEGKRDKKIKNLKLRGILWDNHRIKAKISWDPIPRTNKDKSAKRYHINWEEIQCRKPGQDRVVYDIQSKRPKKSLSASTEETTFKIYELDYDCSYRVTVNKSKSRKTNPDSEIKINIPNCQGFQNKMKAKQLNCTEKE